MNYWQSTYLGRGALPRDLSGFEIETFFTYSESERHFWHENQGDLADYVYRVDPGRTAGSRTAPGQIRWRQ